MPRLLLFTGLILWCTALRAQGPPPVGQWREHLPWNNAINVALGADNTIICATPYAAFTYDIADNSFIRKSKVNGLSDIGVSAMAHNAGEGVTLIAYSNSNLDLWTADRIINIPDIRISNVPGDKTIHSITMLSGKAYLGTGLGIIVIDLEKAQVDDTWRVGSSGGSVRVWGTAFSGDFVYAATEEGLKRASVNSDPSDYRNWSAVLLFPPARQVISSANGLSVLAGDTVFISAGGDNFTPIYHSSGILAIDATEGGLLVSSSQGGQGTVTLVDPAGREVRTFSPPGLSRPRQALMTGEECWIADQDNGLFRVGPNMAERIFPNSPINIATGQMQFIGDALWVAAGTVNEAWNYTFNPNGVYRFRNQFWDGYNQYVYPKIDTLLDFIAVAGQPSAGSVYCGSYGGGLLEITAGGELVIHKQNVLEAAIGDPSSYRVSGLAVDGQSNLWISNYGAPRNLVVRKADGGWNSFSIPFFHSENALSAIQVDELGQKWIVSPKGNGLFLFNSGASVDNTGDDQWRMFRQGRGNGNLPSNNVYCAVMDRNGFIWVGTDKGIAVVNCVTDAFSAGCEAVIPVVQEDDFAGLLFGDEEVLCMAVDGANRKWVGTRNGLWLIDAEGERILSRFTRANSPLLADEINSLAIDPISGELFIATAGGICSYRGTATEGSSGGTNVLVYPNPVPPGYGGIIAVRGLPANAQVKITELDGRLVFQVRAAGGQFTWNGRDYRGNRVSSGVYLVLVSDRENREKLATRIFITR